MRVRLVKRWFLVNGIQNYQTHLWRNRAVGGPFASRSSVTYGDAKVGKAILFQAKVQHQKRHALGVKSPRSMKKIDPVRSRSTPLSRNADGRQWSRLSSSRTCLTAAAQWMCGEML